MVRGRPAVVESKDRRGLEALTRDESQTHGRLVDVTKRVSARLPDAAEVELLGLPDGIPVLSVLVIACDASGQALQVSDVLLPADGQELEDAYRLN
nr:UTRA domain-containing protein [Streptomyces sennicomposti]